jgi:hypothetical protein
MRSDRCPQEPTQSQIRCRLSLDRRSPVGGGAAQRQRQPGHLTSQCLSDDDRLITGGWVPSNTRHVDTNAAAAALILGVMAGRRMGAPL